MVKEIRTMPDLTAFTGTQNYHILNFLRNLKFTDGWECLVRKLECFWLADIVASVQHMPKIRNNNFIVWRIVVKENKGLVEAYSDSIGQDENGNSTFSKEQLLYKQNIEYVDFPEGIFEWYQCDDVVLLKGEY